MRSRHRRYPSKPLLKCPKGSINILTRREEDAPGRRSQTTIEEENKSKNANILINRSMDIPLGQVTQGMRRTPRLPLFQQSWNVQSGDGVSLSFSPTLFTLNDHKQHHN